MNETEKIELICYKGDRIVSRIIQRHEIREKQLQGFKTGWFCVPYQIGFYQGKRKN